MAYRDLRNFIEILEKEGELLRVTEQVSRDLEITEWADRSAKGDGPALLFENVEGFETPVLINAFASVKRRDLALETQSVDDLAARVNGLLDMKQPQGLLDKMKMLPQLAEMANVFPKVVSSGPCQEVVLEGDQVDLNEIPVLTCWPDDGGRFITFPLVFTKNPETGKRNCGMYRMQVFSKNTTGMHWQTHKHGAHHARLRKEAGERIPVAVAIGADPATVFSAIVPLPDDLDEMMFAGFVRKKPVELVKCKTVDLEVPANAEYVLEGWVDPNETKTEGPFGDHTGFYSLADEYPVFHVECITRRKKPVYHTTIVGIPPQEDCWMGEAVERIFLPVIKKQMAEIVDMHLPWAGVFHNCVIVSIKKRYPFHARKIMNAIWGLGQMMFSKVIIVVDHDVDIHNPQELVFHALNAIDPERDFQFTMGPIDSLDHSSRMPDYGSKVGIDATRKWKTEGHDRDWPTLISMDQGIKDKVAEQIKKLGLGF